MRPQRVLLQLLSSAYKTRNSKVDLAAMGKARTTKRWSRRVGLILQVLGSQGGH